MMTIKNIELKHLSQHELLEETKRAVRAERTAILHVLHRLKEIDRRSIHLEIGYGSLHEFCVVEPKYSDGAAYRRIHAMRLIDDLPEAKQAIARGELSLSNAASLEQYFKRESINDDSSRRELLREACGKSKDELQKILYPQAQSETISVQLDRETINDLNRLADLLGLSKSDLNTLIKKAAEMVLKSKDPTLKKTKARSDSRPTGAAWVDAKTHAVNKARTPDQELEASRYISASIKKMIWMRDQSQCTFSDPITKRRCSSTFALQIDHIIPFGCGGTSHPDNLRLLCPNHNRLMAKRVFGNAKIESHMT